MTLNGTEVPDFNNPEGMLTELFWGEKNKADYPTFMDFVTWDTESGIGTFDRYFDGLNSGENYVHHGGCLIRRSSKAGRKLVKRPPNRGSA